MPVVRQVVDDSPPWLPSSIVFLLTPALVAREQRIPAQIVAPTWRGD